MLQAIHDRRGLWAVVPVKLLTETKRRLIDVLSRDERQGLACAMLTDVLSALARARSVAGVIVVTADTTAASIADAAGAFVLTDTQNAGVTAAVEHAARHLTAMNREGMLVVPADVPMLTPEDIDAIVAAHGDSPSVTLVPATTDGGTNALACSPPDAMTFHFGEDSLRLHRAAALAAGIAPTVLELPRVARDIDRPGDVAAFLAEPSVTRTYAYLARAGIAQRLMSTHPSSPWRGGRVGVKG